MCAEKVLDQENDSGVLLMRSHYGLETKNKLVGRLREEVRAAHRPMAGCRQLHSTCLLSFRPVGHSAGECAGL